MALVCCGRRFASLNTVVFSKVLYSSGHSDINTRTNGTQNKGSD
jgi:hypothetical protein